MFPVPLRSLVFGGSFIIFVFLRGLLSFIARGLLLLEGSIRCSGDMITIKTEHKI